MKYSEMMKEICDYASEEIPQPNAAKLIKGVPRKLAEMEEMYEGLSMALQILAKEIEKRDEALLKYEGSVPFEARDTPEYREFSDAYWRKLEHK